MYSCIHIGSAFMAFIMHSVYFYQNGNVGLRGGMVGWGVGEVEGNKCWLSSKDNGAFFKFIYFFFGD